MTDRQASTSSETVTAATAALDQAEAELRNLRIHLAAVTDDTPGGTYCAARSASVAAGTIGTVAHQLRDLAARQSGSVVS